MGNVNDVGLCQEVAAWQRKNQLSRDPQNGWVQARPLGPSYLQGEQLLEWRPTRAAASGRPPPGPGRPQGEEGTSQHRSSSMFVTPTMEMLSPEWHDQTASFGNRGSPSVSRLSSRRGEPPGGAWQQRGRGPVRQASADPRWRPAPGPVRQFSAPARRYGAGPGRVEDTLLYVAPEDFRNSRGHYSPAADNLSFKDALPMRPRTPRGRTSLGSRVLEDTPPWESFPPHSEASGAPASSGSWGPEDEAFRRSLRTSPDREKSPPRIEDTSIGKGLSEFLKRGVAQAAPKTQKQPELEVHSNGGGIIATIQKGVEGIFGHLAVSKEEVLKQRGPMPSPEYEAVPGDDIDQRVEYYARHLPQHLGACLKIYRISRGEYEIGNDVVHLAWQSKVNPPNIQNPNGSIVKEVFVFTASKENLDGPNHDGKEIPCEPLPFYLRHSANVAYDLQYGSKVTKVPQSSRLSFADETGTLLKDGDADAKFNAMTLAIQQVRKREQAAMEWRKRNADGVASPVTSRDSAKGSPSFDDPKSADAPGQGQGSADKDKAAPSPLWQEPSPLRQEPSPLLALSPAEDKAAPSPLRQEPAVATPLRGSGPIRGLDPPQLQLPPPPGPLLVNWGRAGAPREAPAVHPPQFLTAPQSWPHFRPP